MFPSSAADVIVIGAGIVGCAVAHALTAGGHRVQVLDAREPGLGATQASAGVLAPYIEGHESSALCTMGRRSLDLYDGFVAGVATEDSPVFYERRGTIEVAADAGAADRLQQAGAALSASGVDARWLDADAVKRLEPGVTGACGAMHVPTHGYVGVTSLTSALQTAAVRAGAVFRNRVRATRIEPGARGRVTVTTGDARIDADTVVLATGSWSGRIDLAGGVAAPVTPIRGQLLHLRMPSRRLERVVWGCDCYLVPWPDGSVLVGATVEDVGFDERSTVAGVEGLLRAARALVPELATAAFAGVRVGLRPASPDALPIVGPSATIPNVIYAVGHYRNGVLLAPLTALLVRALVEGNATDPALPLLSPARVGL